MISQNTAKVAEYLASREAGRSREVEWNWKIAGIYFEKEIGIFLLSKLELQNVIKPNTQARLDNLGGTIRKCR